MSLFKRGYGEVEKEEKRREEAKKNSGSLFRFFLPKGEAEIHFLTEEPVNFYEHSIKENRGGKEFFDSVPCSGADCPHCANGSRPTFKSAFLIVDHRPYTYNKDGKDITIEESIRMYVVGTKVAGVIQRKSKRYGLVDNRYLIERLGKDTNTTYNFENLDKEKVSKKEIEKLLPESLREMYDGSMDSLYDIIEFEIEKLMPKVEDEEDEEVTSKYSKKIVTADDDEDEDDYEPPTPKTIKKKKIGLKIKKK